MTSEANIRDLGSLDEMKLAFGECADSILKLLAGIDSYLNNVVESLEQAVEHVQKKLDEAQQKLDRAEDALSRCEASQHYDEERGETVPSCNYEAAMVSRCREEVSRWQKKLDEAKNILSEAKSGIDRYRHKSSGLTSPGGEQLMQILATDTCQRAGDKLDTIKEKLLEFANFQILEPGTELKEEFRNEHRSDDDMPLDEEQRESEYKRAFEEVRKEQKSDSSYYNVADANGIMVCHKCGRPFALCVCKKC